MYATFQGLFIAVSYNICFFNILEGIYRILVTSVRLSFPQAHIVSKIFSWFASETIDEG